MDETPHVLIVDDDTRIRELLGSYLRRNGFRVSTAANAADARRKMASLLFDVVVRRMPPTPGGRWLRFFSTWWCWTS